MAYTKAQLEALKNSILASAQPITAAQHRSMVQNIIDEMFDPQSRGNLLAGVQADGIIVEGDTALVIRSGQAYLMPLSALIAENSGRVNVQTFNYSGTNVFELSESPLDILYVSLNGQTLASDGIAWTLSGQDVTIGYDLEADDFIQVCYSNKPLSLVGIGSAEAISIFDERLNIQKDQEGGIAANDTTTLNVATIADFATVQRNGRTTAYIKEAGRSGIFDYVASGLTANGGTIFEAEDGGFWVRRYDGPIQGSWFGLIEASDFDGSIGFDNRAIFQAIFSIGGEINIVGDYLTTKDVLLTSDSILNLSNSRIKIFPNSDDAYTVFNTNGSDNIKIYGGELIGDKYTHTGVTGQWGHGIYINKSNHVKIEGTKFSNFWGDGIYIGSGDSDYSENISLFGIACNDNRRQGASIVRARNVTIVNSVFSNTSGQTPSAGIDIEPNNGDTIENVYIENCEFFGNEGCGIDISSPGSANTKYVDGVKIRDCKTYDNDLHGVRVICDVTNSLAIENIDIDGLDSYGNTLNSFYTRYGDNIKIINSDLQSTGGRSVYIYRSANLKINNNRILGDQGIYIDTTLNFCQIIDNDIETDNECIIDSDSNIKRDVLIMQNRLMSVNNNAISLVNLDHSLIQSNKIKDTGLNGILLNAARTNNISLNIIQSVGLFAVSDFGSINLTGGSRKNIITNNSIINSSAAPGSTVASGVMVGASARNNTIVNNSFNETDGVVLGFKVRDLSGNTNFIQINDEYNRGATVNKPAGSKLTIGYSYFDTTTKRRSDWDGTRWWDYLATEDLTAYIPTKVSMTLGAAGSDLLTLNPAPTFSNSLSVVQYDSTRAGLSNYPSVGRGAILIQTDPSTAVKTYLAIGSGTDPIIQIAQLNASSVFSGWKIIGTQSAASADTASAVGATYSQAEVQAILTELRDLKTKMRTAGLLTP